MTAKEVWEKDFNKLEKARKNGFEILVVWESDFDCQKKDVINECVKFLMN